MLTKTDWSSNRLKELPPYLFVEIDKAKRQAKAEGRDIIDLGIGDPDMPTPQFIVEELYRAANDPSTHKYALDQGLPELREEIANWYKNRFDVTLDPQTEILPLIGSKEGIAHAPFAYVNSGDYALIPDPGYPVYTSATILAGGKPYTMPLKEENSYLPELRDIPDDVARKAKIMYLNYPNNPTSAVCTSKDFENIIEWAQKHQILILHDAAYTELNFDGCKPESYLQARGAKEIGIEFHSLSKTFNMTGWRIGFACGNKEALQSLAKIKSNIDSGIFTAIQWAGIKALKNVDSHLKTIDAIYRDRRDIFVDGLNNIGWKTEKPKATFYIWTKALQSLTSTDTAKKVLNEADIVATPGNGFGDAGEGYVRFALTVSKERLKEAVDRLEKII